MTAFLAIVKLTCKSAIRSHIFQILLGVLIFTIIVLPLTVVGNGTAQSYIQVSLQYCLGAISFLLSMSTIWLGCFTMGTDVESYQLHMVISKPISRIIVWLGKCTGVILVHSVLLVISSLIVYAFILLQFYYPGFISLLKFPTWLLCIVTAILSLAAFFFNFVLKKESVYKFSFIVMIISGCLLGIHYLIPEKNSQKQQFSAKDKERITNEVLVGRRVYLPNTPKTHMLTQDTYNKYLDELTKQNKKLTENQKRNLKLEIHKRVVASIGEVFPGRTYFWEYSGIEKAENTPLYLRYRVYVGKVSTKEQRETMGLWGARLFVKIPIKPVKDDKTKKKPTVQTRAVFSTRTQYPEKIMCGIFTEIKMGSAVIDDKGSVIIGFANYDPQGKKLFFQQADGPKLMIKVASFFENYARGVFMIFAKITVLAGLSCAMGGIVSIPVAIFSVISYLLFGVFASYLIGIDDKMNAMGGPSVNSSLYDIIGNNVSRGLMFFIIPMQNFEVSSLLADGELIEFSYIARVLLFSVALKCLLVITFGIWLYRKREMGLVVRK